MLGWSRRSRATAETPSRRGMCRSMTTASGPSSSASSIAARPSRAVPTTASSRLALDQRRERIEERLVVVREENANRAAGVGFSHGPEVSLVAHVFATTSSQSRGDRRGARSRRRPPRRGHGPVGDPLRGARRAARRARARVRRSAATSRRRSPRRRRPATSRRASCRRSRTRRERIATLVARAAREDSLPLVLGGDHSVALGTLGGPGRGARTGRRRSGSTRTAI